MKAELSISGSEPQLMEAGKGDAGSITVYVRQWDKGYSVHTTIQECFLHKPASSENEENKYDMSYTLLFKMFIKLLQYYLMTQSQWVH